MGKGFGELAYLRGIITYKVSPYELNPFAGILTKSPLNVVRRIRSQMLYIGPPFILGYAVYEYGKYEAYKDERKNPKDYENDV